jgi:hypothetical protein
MVLLIPILAAFQALACSFVTSKLLHITHFAASLGLAVAYFAILLGLRFGAPRIGYPLGLLLAYGWALTLGLNVYYDPHAQGARWLVGFYAMLGLVFGALANVVNPLRPWIWTAQLPVRMVRALLRRRRSPPRQRSEQERTAPPSQQQQHPPQPQPRTESNDPWAILGIAPGATPDQIQSAYRQLMRAYHPDRVQTLGLEIRELAERKAKQINAAYETLRGLRDA